MKKQKRQKFVALATTPLIAGVLMVSSASAATATTNTNNPTLNKQNNHRMSHRAPGVMGDTSAIASILGMSEEDVKTALSNGTTLDTLITQKGLNKETVLSQLRAEHEAQMDAQIKADITSGKITQAQADEMKARHTQEEANRKQTLADALGISVETLTAEMNSGKTIDQLATAHGLTADSLKAKLDTARETEMKARLSADVASGKITQAQADKMLQHANNMGKKGPHYNQKAQKAHSQKATTTK